MFSPDQFVALWDRPECGLLAEPPYILAQGILVTHWEVEHQNWCWMVGLLAVAFLVEAAHSAQGFGRQFELCMWRTVRLGQGELWVFVVLCKCNAKA